MFSHFAACVWLCCSLGCSSGCCLGKPVSGALPLTSFQHFESYVCLRRQQWNQARSGGSVNCWVLFDSHGNKKSIFDNITIPFKLSVYTNWGSISNWSTLAAAKWLKMVVSDHFLDKYSCNPIQTWRVHCLGECLEFIHFWATLAK